MSETKKLRVVIADDHAVARLGLSALLASADDIELVGEGTDGREALRLCADLSPDVLVIDLSMRGMNGLEAMRELVRRPKPPRVLTLTMHEEEDYLIPALEAGANGYIVKSAASSTLLQAIRAVAAGETWVRPRAASVLAAGFARRSAQGELRTRYATLSEREREVFRLVALGHGSPKIGEILHISGKTVDTYRRRVNDKLEIATRAEYVQAALSLEVLTSQP